MSFISSSRAPYSSPSTWSASHLSHRVPPLVITSPHVQVSIIRLFQTLLSRLLLFVRDIPIPCKTRNFAVELPAGTLHYAFDFFFAAHRAFIIADSFFRMAALIGLRPACFFGAALAFFGADLPFHFAQRCFIAAEIRLRAAGLIR